MSSFILHSLPSHSSPLPTEMAGCSRSAVVVPPPASGFKLPEPSIVTRSGAHDGGGGGLLDKRTSADPGTWFGGKMFLEPKEVNKCIVVDRTVNGRNANVHDPHSLARGFVRGLFDKMRNGGMRVPREVRDGASSAGAGGAPRATHRALLTSRWCMARSALPFSHQLLSLSPHSFSLPPPPFSFARSRSRRRTMRTSSSSGAAREAATATARLTTSHACSKGCR